VREEQGVPLIDLDDPDLDEDPWSPIYPHGWWDHFMPHYCPPPPTRTAEEGAKDYIGVIWDVLRARDHHGYDDADVRIMYQAQTRIKAREQFGDVAESDWVDQVAAESYLTQVDLALEWALGHDHADPGWMGRNAAERWIANRVIALEESHCAVTPDIPCDLKEVVRSISRMDPEAIGRCHRYADDTPFGPRCIVAFIKRWHEVIDKALVDIADKESGS